MVLELIIVFVIIFLLYLVWCSIDIRLNNIEDAIKKKEKPYLSKKAIDDIRTLSKQGYSKTQIAIMYNRSLSDFMEELRRVNYHE